MEDLVSIIMPAYNVDEYIEESIRSIQAQTYPNWELIVVNDGSTDTTQAVVERLASQDSRIRLVTQPNGGVSRARNRGLELARGEYISFLDGDDLWEPTFLRELIDAKKRANVGMAYCGYDHFYAGKFRRKYRYRFRSGRILADAIDGTVRLHIGAILVDRVIVEEHCIRFTEDCPIAEDWEFIAKILTHTLAEPVQRSLMLYRVRHGSAINSSWDWSKHIHALWVQDRIAVYVRDHLVGPELQVVLKSLAKATAYKTYKFLWRMVKYGYHVEARELMQDYRFTRYLESLNIEELTHIDRLKWRIVLSKKNLWWRLSRYAP